MTGLIGTASKGKSLACRNTTPATTIRGSADVTSLLQSSENLDPGASGSKRQYLAVNGKR
jgi:hypothetical protein